jgi:transcriptional regulator with XRE-family HTH domain
MHVAKGIRGIRRAFDASGMNLTEFAKRSGVTIQTAHGWVHGTHGVKLRRLPRLARVLGTTVAELLA